MAAAQEDDEGEVSEVRDLVHDAQSGQGARGLGARRAALAGVVARVSAGPRRESASRHTTLKAAITASMVGTGTSPATAQVDECRPPLRPARPPA